MALSAGFWTDMLSIGQRYSPFAQRGPVGVCCDMVTLMRAINFLFAFINQMVTL